MHEGGAAIMMNKRSAKSLIEWNPISKRFITARFYSQYRRVTVIQVYATHNERDEEDKEQFYTELQETLDGCSRNDISSSWVTLTPKWGMTTRTMRG